MCLCAGLERDKFDNKTVTFEEHIKVEHNMWHYLFFIVLVKVKDSTEYTGPESYVAQMIRVCALSTEPQYLANRNFRCVCACVVGWCGKRIKGGVGRLKAWTGSFGRCT